MRWAGFADEALKIESYITVLLASPMNITSARWDDDGKAKGLDEKIGVKLDTIERGKKYRLTVWKKAELAPESVVSNIVLTTDNPKLKEKIVPVAFTIMNDVELHPQRLYYGEMLIPPGATKGFERTLQHHRGARRFAQGSQGRVEQGRHDGEDPGAHAGQVVPGHGARPSRRARSIGSPAPSRSIRIIRSTGRSFSTSSAACASGRAPRASSRGKK